MRLKWKIGLLRVEKVQGFGKEGKYSVIYTYFVK